MQISQHYQQSLTDFFGTNYQHSSPYTKYTNVVFHMYRWRWNIRVTKDFKDIIFHICQSNSWASQISWNEFVIILPEATTWYVCAKSRAISRGFIMLYWYRTYYFSLSASGHRNDNWGRMLLLSTQAWVCVYNYRRKSYWVTGYKNLNMSFLYNPSYSLWSTR